MGVDKKILVAGGGVSGLTTAVEAAEAGAEVVLVERNPYLGGRVALFNQYFPKLCPPACGLEINFRRIKRNPNISVFTQTVVESVSGGPGNYEAVLRVEPRYVNDNCTACGKCAEVCETEIPDPVNYGLKTVKAAYLPHAMAFPFKYVLDKSIVGTEDGRRCAEACAYGAIDLEMQPQTVKMNVGAIVWATGWDPYDAAQVDYLGYGRIPDVVTSVEFERIAAYDGPTKGQIRRTSDQKPVKKIAFIQCAGSRDENHLPYCSGVCCLASLKHATYALEKDPETQVFIYYIDIRAMGKYEDFYTKVSASDRVSLVKGKVARISPDGSGGLVIEGEDITAGGRVRETVDMAVLAVGMAPGTKTCRPGLEMIYDDFGFAVAPGASGIIPAGCVKAPMEVAASVQDATAAALKAVQRAMGR
jgi:quinone-modifying oxidoreductase subunit QmoA